MKERGINYDKIIRDEQNRLRAEDFKDIHEMESCGCNNCMSTAEWMRDRAEEEQWMKDYPPQKDFYREEILLQRYALKRLKDAKAREDLP